MESEEGRSHPGRKGIMPNTGFVRFDQVNRVTETRYRLLDTAQDGKTLAGADLPENDARFVTECEKHNRIVGWENLHQARMAMAMPIWCAKCKTFIRANGLVEGPGVEARSRATA